MSSPSENEDWPEYLNSFQKIWLESLGYTLDVFNESSPLIKVEIITLSKVYLAYDKFIGNDEIGHRSTTNSEGTSKATNENNPCEERSVSTGTVKDKSGDVLMKNMENLKIAPDDEITLMSTCTNELAPLQNGNVNRDMRGITTIGGVLEFMRDMFLILLFLG